MKAKHIEEVLEELRSIRKRAKKAQEAYEKMTQKLAQVEELIAGLEWQPQQEPDSGKKSKKGGTDPVPESVTLGQQDNADTLAAENAVTP